MSSEQDFLDDLIPELQEYLLSYFGATDLLTCCCVSRTWNKLVSSCETVWYRACCNIGLIVGAKEARTAEQWKRLLIEMTLRKQQMRTSACFEESDFSSNLLSARVVHYHAAKIVIDCSKMKLEMWNVQRKNCVQAFSLPYCSAVTSVKLGDRFLVAASDRGFIACWDLATSSRVLYNHPKSSNVSYDFMDDYNILIASFKDRCLEAWNMSIGVQLWSVADHNSSIEKVLLAPKTNHEQEISLWLFTMDKDIIFVRKVLFRIKHETIDRFCAETISTIPRHPTGRSTTELQRSATPGLLFYEKFLYFLREQNVICKWDLEISSVISETRLNARVETLLGVGNQYMAFIGTEPDTNGRYFFAMEKETEKIIVMCNVPNVNGVKDTSCIGDTDWLDGLDGENDRGVVFLCARINMPLYVLRWTTRGT